MVIKIAKLVKITPMSLWFMVLITPMSLWFMVLITPITMVYGLWRIRNGGFMMFYGTLMVIL